LLILGKRPDAFTGFAINGGHKNRRRI